MIDDLWFNVDQIINLMFDDQCLTHTDCTIFPCTWELIGWLVGWFAGRLLAWVGLEVGPNLCLLDHLFIHLSIHPLSEYHD